MTTLGPPTGRVPGADELGRLGDRLADALTGRAERLVAAAVAELGFSLGDMERELDTTVRLLRGLPSVACWSVGRRAIAQPGQDVAIVFPYNMSAGAVWDIACLMAGGNRVRVRFSERSGELATTIAEVLEDAAPQRVRVDFTARAEFLRDVLGNADTPLLVVYGGEALGDELLRVPASGQRLVFEGPGNDPVVVLPGCDPKVAATRIAASKAEYSGQQCVAPELVVVAETLEAPLVAHLVTALTGSAIGPVASRQVAERIAAQLDEARAAGATIATGGRVVGDQVDPTIVCGARPGISIWDDESFGPVLAVASFTSIDEAVALATSTRFGLHATVLGPDADDVAAALRGPAYATEVSELRHGSFGVVTTNRSIFEDDTDFVAAFGGYGISGWIRDGTSLRQGPKHLVREATVV